MRSFGFWGALALLIHIGALNVLMAVGVPFWYALPIILFVDAAIWAVAAHVVKVFGDEWTVAVFFGIFLPGMLLASLHDNASGKDRSQDWNFFPSMLAGSCLCEAAFYISAFMSGNAGPWPIAVGFAVLVMQIVLGGFLPRQKDPFAHMRKHMV